MPSSIEDFRDFLASAAQVLRAIGGASGIGRQSRLPHVKVRNGRGTGTLSGRKLLKDMVMNKMNPVDTGIQPIDRESERHRLSVVIITAALALFVGGSMVFYSF
jgi:hypothetical protein